MVGYVYAQIQTERTDNVHYRLTAVLAGNIGVAVRHAVAYARPVGHLRNRHVRLHARVVAQIHHRGNAVITTYVDTALCLYVKIELYAEREEYRLRQVVSYVGVYAAHKSAAVKPDRSRSRRNVRAHKPAEQVHKAVQHSIRRQAEFGKAEARQVDVKFGIDYIRAQNKVVRPALAVLHFQHQLILRHIGHIYVVGKVYVDHRIETAHIYVERNIRARKRRYDLAQRKLCRLRRTHIHLQTYLLVVHKREHAFGNVVADSFKAGDIIIRSLYKRAVIAALHLCGNISVQTVQREVYTEVVKQSDNRPNGSACRDFIREYAHVYRFPGSQRRRTGLRAVRARERGCPRTRQRRYIYFKIHIGKQTV